MYVIYSPLLQCANTSSGRGSTLTGVGMNVDWIGKMEQSGGLHRDNISL